MKDSISIKWIYASRDDNEGTRILVDRLLPYGRDLDELGVDLWWRDAAPSSAIKRQYTQGELNWKEFARLYRNELLTQPQKLKELQEQAQAGQVTLLTLEREPEQSHAVVLKEALALWQNQEELQATVIESR